MKKWTLSMFFLLLVSSCAGGAPNANAPVSSEETPAAAKRPATATALAPSRRGAVFLDSAEILILESFPRKFALHLTGRLPTPCHQLRVDVQPVDAENRVMVEAYSQVEEGKICAQMVQPFEETTPLECLAEGHYTVWVNGKMTAEFTR